MDVVAVLIQKITEKSCHTRITPESHHASKAAATASYIFFSSM